MKPVAATSLLSRGSAESAESSVREFELGCMFGKGGDDDDLEGEVVEEKADLITTKVPLQSTSYDAVVMALVLYEDEEYRNEHGKAALMQFLTGFILHVGVVALQMTVVGFLLLTTTQSEADPFRDDIEGKTQIILNAIRTRTHIPIDGPGMTLCQEMDTLQGAHLLVQFIWSARMLQEFADAMWRATYVSNMGAHKVASLADAVVEDADGHIVMTHTEPCPTLFLMLISPLPQSLCAVALWWTGAKFLFFAHTMGVLIMKAISIAFITSLDEMMYKSFAPRGFKETVGKTRYLYTKAKPNFHWNMWGISIAKMTFAVALSLFIYWGAFGHVTAFRGACWNYWDVFPNETPHRGNETLWTTFLKGIERK